MDDFVGSVVLALSGRDSGALFVVLFADTNGFLYYANGRDRTVEKPKKKKQKHVRVLGKSPIMDISAVTNKQLRKALGAFKAKEGACAPEKEE